MKPRIIDADGGTIDASKVRAISPVERRSLQSTELFTFDVIGDSDRLRLQISSSDKHKLDEIRRRLIGFVWPNADVFDASNATDFSDSATS